MLLQSLQNVSLTPIGGLPLHILTVVAATVGHSQIEIVSRDFNELTGATMEVLKNSTLPVTLFSCEEYMDRQLYKIKPIQDKMVLINCPSTELVELQYMIRTLSLESQKVNWFYLVGEEEANLLKEGVLRYIREGTKLIVMQTIGRNDVILSKFKVTATDEKSFIELGSWNSNGILKELIFPMEYSDLMGRQLTTIGTRFGGVFYRIGGAGGEEPGGIDAELMKILASKMNFSLKLGYTEDNTWGALQSDGSFSGIIGKISRHEGDIGMDGITHTISRDAIIDFSTPYMFENSIILSKTPGVLNPAFAIVRPYTNIVWTLIFISLLSLSLFSGVLITAEKKKKTHAESWRIRATNTIFSVIHYFFNFLRILLVQDHFLVISGYALPLLLILWFFFSLVVASGYSSALTAALARPTYSKPVDTLKDVVEACRNGDVDLLLFRDSVIDVMIKNAESGIFKELQSVVNEEKSYLSNVEEYLDVVENGEGVSTMSKAYAVYKTFPRGTNRFHFSRDYINFQYYSLAFPTGSPFKKEFDKHLQSLFESHIIENLEKMENLKIGGIKFLLDIKRRNTKAVQSKSLSLKELQGVFILLSLSYLLIIPIFILEKKGHLQLG